jgi:uncharacterized membrane protein YoaK (UPF0700 family)
VNARLILLLVVLTLCAGYADAVAFFGLGVFTANMTGNTVLLGGALAARWLGMHLSGSLGIGLPALSIAAFAAGAAVAAFALRGETGRPPLRTMAALGAIVAALAGAAWLQHAGGAAAGTIALLSLAMGVQSVVAVRAGVPGVSTTFVTGSLVTAILRFEGQHPGRRQRAEGGTNAGVWACYLAGALAGTIGLRLLGSGALWVDAAVVALLIAVV